MSYSTYNTMKCSENRIKGIVYHKWGSFYVMPCTVFISCAIHLMWSYTIVVLTFAC